MSILSLQEKRSKLLHDAHEIMSGENVNAEQRTKASAMLADANALKSDIETLTALEAGMSESRSQHSVPRGAPAANIGTESRSFEERREATGKALRSFLKGEQFERRDLTVALDGSVTVPVGVTDPKIAKKSSGSVYDLVYKFRTSTGEAVKVPLVNDLSNGFVLNSAAISTTDPSIGGVTIQVDDVRSNPILLDNSLVQDVEFDILTMVENAINDRYMRTAANWITNGNGSNVGALATGYTGITGAATGTVGYGDFAGLLASLDPAYAQGAVFLMSNATLANGVLNIKDGNGRPIFLPFNDGGISGFAGTIFGFPVKLNPFQPALATGNVAVQFGNFEAGYTFREVLPGIRIQTTTQRYIELNRLGVVAFARVGGAVTNPGTVSAGTTQPVVSLTVK